MQTGDAPILRINSIQLLCEAEDEVVDRASIGVNTHFVP
jgi:hypothetical protein